MNANQKLMQFIQSVNSNVDTEIAQMLTAAQNEADHILANSEAEGKELADRQLATAKKALSAKYRRRLAQSSYQLHTAILQRRARLLNQLFTALRQRIAAFADSDAYLDWLKQLLKTIRPEEGATILLRSEDMQYESALREICPALKFEADSSIALGGCAILSSDRKRCINHTLDDALKDQIQNFHREQHWTGGAQV